MQQIVSSSDQRLLEIGSGTGQHAVYLAPHFPHMIWVTSDLKDNHRGIQLWLEESTAPNIIGPGVFEVGKDKFPNGNFDIVFTANTFHIMHWCHCEELMKMLGKNLSAGAKVLIYGPMKYGGNFTSHSNQEFDKSLKERDPLMGIREFEDICQQMEKRAFVLFKDFDMPAHNRLLVFEKKLLSN